MLNLLLVEDDKAVAHVVSRIMTIEGINVILANSADEAIRRLKMMMKFDVAIVDRVLPGKIQGEELAAVLRKSWPSVGVVQMSGYPEEARQLAEDTVSDQVLCKPVSRLQLIDSVFYAYQAGSVRREEQDRNAGTALRSFRLAAS